MNQQRKKVLIISYYWPPSGGAGVQRWLKLSKYLVRMDVDVFVLTVDPKKSSYHVFDYSLEKDIDPRITIFKTNSFEPINIYSKLVGKENVPTAGFSNVDNQKLSQKLVNGIRSNLFIPDPRIGWKKYAISKAKELIKQYGINNLITTSPPHSTQMIGRDLKKQFGGELNWIVDFRDPWTDIYYYDLLQHSALSHYINSNYERSVIEGADKIITVSEGFKSIFLSKSNKIESSKISVIPNGYDKEDFKNVDKTRYKNDIFTIRYTGTMAENYKPFVFFDALSLIVKNNPEVNFIFESVGILSQVIKNYIESLEIPYKYIPSVPHSEVVDYQSGADLLLLVIPLVNKGEGIVPGKVFEYMASKTPIICISDDTYDVNSILEETNSGKAFNRDSVQEIYEEILSSYDNNNTDTDDCQIIKYSRLRQAEEYFRFIK